MNHPNITPAEFRSSDIDWPESVRIVSASLPPLVEYERYADPDDMIAAAEIAALSSASGISVFGNLSLVPSSLWMTGEGARFVMPTFTFPSDEGSRFAPPGAYGVFYASNDRETAIAESSYHYLRRLHEPSVPVEHGTDMRVLVGNIQATVTDLRGHRATAPTLYSLNSYRSAQAFGRQVHAANGSGIAYDSVRHDAGECIAVFRPVCIRSCIEVATITYKWDGHHLKVTQPPASGR